MYTVVKNYHVPHSITFGDKNSWDDWHLVSQVRPSFSPPKQKTKYLEIPYSDGSLDISQSLTGYPVFDNREGSFEFIVVNGFGDWVDRYHEIMAYLNGRTMRAILEDDPEYYYEGRFWVDEWNSSSPWSTIKINYLVEPYKWFKWPSTGWLWDPFIFAKDRAKKTQFSRIEIDTSDWKTIDFGGEEAFGEAPVCPEFQVSTTDNKGFDVKYDNDDLGIHVQTHFPNGNTKNPAVVFFRNKAYTFQIKGHGTLNLYFRIGAF